MAKTYALNFAGAAYDFADEDKEGAWANRVPKMAFYVQKLTNASSNDVKTVGGREPWLAQATEKTVPLALPTEQELNFTTGTKVLWVGMRPSEAPKYATIVSKKPGIKGKTTSSVQLKYDAKALRIVVPYNKTTVTYYALVDADDAGLCTGIDVKNTEVFFFPEWRDDQLNNSLEKRKLYTNNAIRIATEAKPKAKHNPITTAVAQISGRKAIGNEVVALICTYLAGGEPSLLKRAKELLDEDVGGGEANGKIKALFAGELLNDSDATLAKTEIEALWPALKVFKIKPKQLATLSAAIDQAGFQVQAQYGRAFLVLAIPYLRSVDDPELPVTLDEIYTTVKLQMGTHKAGADLSPSQPLRNLLSAIRAEITAIRNQHSGELQAYKDHVGDHVTPDSLDTVMARLAVIPDVDAARVNVAHLFRLVTEKVAAIGDGTSSRLRELEDQLKTYEEGLDTEYE